MRYPLPPWQLTGYRQPPVPATRSTEEVAAGVRRLGSRWVNWYLLEHADGLTVIDAGLPAHRAQFAAALDTLGRSTAEVSDVVLTHWHADHVGCGEWLRSELGATVWAPRAEVPLVTGAEKPPRPNFLPYLWRPAIARYLTSVVREGAARVEPIAGVEAYEADASDLPGGLRAIATPGHTRGHCALLEERRGILFCGDALATVDFLTWRPEPRPLLRRINHDNDAVLDSLARLEEVDAAVLLPGHGAPWREGAGRAAKLARQAGIPG
jgi:glyoxylase-like metal-dependent hydrolase (beta-lactamase superfamily II)